MSKKSHQVMVEQKKMQEKKQEKKEQVKKKKLKAKKKKTEKHKEPERLKPLDPLLESEVVIPPRIEGVVLDTDGHWKIKKDAKLGLIPRPLPPEHTISRTELKSLLDAQTPGIVVVDTRQEIDLRFEPPIPGALHIPAEHVVGWFGGEDAPGAAKKASPSKDTQYIFSGNPEDTTLQINMVLNVLKAGFRAKQLINGHREWNKYYNPKNERTATWV